MIILKATTESLQLTTSSAANIDFSVSFADLTTAAFSPSSNEGTIASATLTSILVAPAASTQRQIKLITITNRHATLSNSIIVQKVISATTYNLMPTATLLAGEVIQYLDGQGWLYYSATGALKTSQTAPGSTTQVMFNNAGALSGDPGLTWTNASGSLGITGASARIQLGAVSSVPAAPAASTLEIYSQAIAGKMQLMKQGPSGDAEAVQASLWQNNVVLFTCGPSATAGTFMGTVGVQTTATSPVQTTTNPYTAMRRMLYTNTAVASQQNGIRTEQMFFRGAATGMGGFFFACRFGLTTWSTNNRLFIGLTGSVSGNTGNIVTVDPTTVANTIGFGVNTADTAITFMHIDGTTTVTSDTISGQPTLASGNAYDAYIYARPNDTTVYYRLENALTGTVIIDSSTTTTLPTNTTLLYGIAAIGNVAATAAIAAIGINRLYIETNR
ncbi:MAG TPA: hypothetical protein VIM31_00985 [Candidatus Microsaccharimonas sp.]|jgi:hypothetical protein